MPAYSYECPKHGQFEIRCRLAEWSDEKPCPKCGKDSEQVLLPSKTRGVLPEAITIHVAADGSVRFPAHKNAPIPKGFEKRELTTIREVEKFERTMNQRLSAEASQHHENEEKFFSKVYEQNRSDLRTRMASMSPLGRAFAQLAIDRNNNRKRASSDCGFFTEVLHMDQSNREQYRDEQTSWRARKS